ncbi:MAG: Protein recA [uncultured bacterium]|nr:MAG: Protein recA [uncultured bacterium]
MKIGVMFGNPETTPGGKALKYYASVRIEVRKIESIKVGQDINGIRVVAKVVKNKVAPPFRKAEFDIMFNEGISKEANILDVGTDLNVIKKSGAWYEYNGEKLGQGKEASRVYLKSNPKLRDDLAKKIKETVKQSNEIPLELGMVSAEDSSVPMSEEIE